MGTRNKVAGSKYELEIVHRFKNSCRFFEHIATSRLVSRLRDGQKIDLCSIDEDTYGRLQYNVQTKTIKGQPNYELELNKLPEIEGIINVFLHKKTEKRGTRFFTTGNYAFMTEDNFFRLVADRERYRIGFEILNQYFDSISDEFKEEVHKQLENLGL